MDWSVRMADSVMQRHQTLGDKWAYEYGLTLKGIEHVYNKTADEKYFNYIKRSVDELLNDDGTEIKGYRSDEYNIDHLNNGKQLLYLYNKTGLKKYETAARMLREQLNTHPRTSEGAFWHKNIYPNQMWLDGLYMGSPFYAQFISLFGDSADFDDITKQFLICEKHTKDDVTGLLYHAWDESKQMFWCNKETGCSEHFWGRAVGWFVMALADVLDYLPKDHKDRNELIRMLNEILTAVMKVIDPERHVWYQVLNLSDRKGNYIEASASCMITYAMAKGYRMGYLDKEWKEHAIRSFKGIVDEFVTVTKNGLINLNKICNVGGLGGKDMRDGTFEYYISEPIVTNDGKGVGAFINAAVQIELIESRLEYI